MSSEGTYIVAQTNWSAEDPNANARRNSERVDRQARARAEDRRTAGRVAGRGKRSI